MPEVYDEIVSDYNKVRDSCLFTKYETPVFIKSLGDVTGLSVLDFACGSGFYTRKIKVKGAATVVGVDICSDMLAGAIESERVAPLGIEYQCVDVVSYSHAGGALFDVVTAFYLLCHAKSEEELVAMCRSAYVNLKPGGRCVLTSPVFHESHENDVERYSAKAVPVRDSHVEGGVEMQTTLYSEDQSSSCSFREVHWFKEVVVRSLEAAGFRSVEAIQVVVGQWVHVFTCTRV